MIKHVVLFSILVLSGFAAVANGADVILNEYNAVKGSEYLKNDGTDTYWGRVEGNGGDWFELVVITDHLDMRGWGLEIWDDGAYDSTLHFTDNAIWSDMRAGTIITISEDLADDVSFDPCDAGDWWINVQASDDASGTYIEADNFPVSNDDWQLTIRDAFDNIIFGPAGEGINPDSGVGSTEICKLEENPSALITPAGGNYQDGSSSTFGSPNIWDGGAEFQDFSGLRGWCIPEPTSICLLAVGGLIAFLRKRKG